MEMKYSTLLQCAHAISDAHHADRAGALSAMQAIVTPLIVDDRDNNQLRAIDIIARGHDDQIAAQAVEVLADAGSLIANAPTQDSAPPLHAACYFGNWMVTKSLLEYEVVDVHAKATARGMRLQASYPVHAVAAGFRSSREEGYGNCLQLLIHNGADINVSDRMRKKPIDIALSCCATTGERSLVDALFSFGVKPISKDAKPSEISTMAIASAMSRANPKNHDLGAAAMKSLMVGISRDAKKTAQ